MADTIPLYWINAESTIPFLLEQINISIKKPMKPPMSAPSRSEPREIVLPQEEKAFPPPRKGFFRRLFSIFGGRDPLEMCDPRFLDPYATYKEYNEHQQRREREEQYFLFSQIKPVGDYVRLKEIIPSIDLLAATFYPEELLNELEQYSMVEDVVERTETSLTIHLHSDYWSIIYPQELDGITLRIFTVKENMFGAAMVWYNSSEEYRSYLQKKAEESGYRFDFTGFYQGEREMNVTTERELFRYLKLPMTPAELRDPTMNSYWTKPRSVLIKQEELQGDLHLHSTWSDGVSSIDEIVELSMLQGLKYIAVTDHSKNVKVAGGMDENKILQYWHQVDQINQRLAMNNRDFRVLKGVEMDILVEGGLDFSEEILKKADWVIASMHYGLDQPREMIHRRFMDAMECPYVSVIGHPTNRLLNIMDGVDLDPDFLFQKAAQYGKYLELNSQPKRLDLCSFYCHKAKEYGVKLVISTDSHLPEQLSYLKFGINIARAAGLQKEDVINTNSWKKILQERKQNIMKSRGQQ